MLMIVVNFIKIIWSQKLVLNDGIKAFEFKKKIKKNHEQKARVFIVGFLFQCLSRFKGAYWISSNSSFI